MHQNQKQKHVPVLLHEVLEYLAPKASDAYLDLTAGYGGHASEILQITDAPEKAVLVDRDAYAVSQLEQKLPGTKIIHSDFLSAATSLLTSKKQFDVILADLGVSSPHLNIASRGFSISQEGPLDMRMDQSQSLTAEQIVNEYDAARLTKILREYGEEPKASRIAARIVESRPITTTSELAKIVQRCYPGHSRAHPATRTFQALRIEVNDELGLLKRALPVWLQLLAPGGRIAVISFHSLEDRLVKQFLASHAGNRFDAELELLTKRPVTASNEEIVSNPRARSAKLRAAVKIKIERE